MSVIFSPQTLSELPERQRLLLAMQLITFELAQIEEDEGSSSDVEKVSAAG